MSSNDNFKEILKTAAGQPEIAVDDEKLEKFDEYKAILIDWNSRMNLTAIRDVEGMAVKHYVDSLTCFMLDDLKKFNSFIDVGTGPGFPGLVIKIMRPEVKLVTLDSVGKKVDFVNHVIKELDLKDAEAMKVRAEDLARNSEYREKFGCSITRGVGSMSIISEYCLPYVKVGGCFIPYKSGEIDEELNNSKKAVQILGGKIEEVIKFQLPDTDIGRSFVKIKKNKNTAKKYPRKAGLPAKEPL